MVLMETLYNPLLIAHLLVTFVLIGAMTHNLFCVFDYTRGRFNRQKLELRYARVSFWTYVTATRSRQ